MERLPRELYLNILSFVGKEKVRQTIYARGMQQQVPGFAIFDAGISVYTTPDWKVFDPSSSSKFGFLQIKCPYSKRGNTLDQASSDPDFSIEEVGADFLLNKSDFYYAQVQGQLAVTGFPWCDFCVYLSDSNEFILILIAEKWATAQIEQLLFQLCTFIYCWASKKSPKLFKNQWRISTCRSHT